MNDFSITDLATSIVADFTNNRMQSYADLATRYNTDRGTVYNALSDANAVNVNGPRIRRDMEISAPIVADYTSNRNQSLSMLAARHHTSEATVHHALHRAGFFVSEFGFPSDYTRTFVMMRFTNPPIDETDAARQAADVLRVREWLAWAEGQLCPA